MAKSKEDKLREKQEMEQMFRRAQRIENHIIKEWDEKEKRIAESNQQIEEVRKAKRKAKRKELLRNPNTYYSALGLLIIIVFVGGILFASLFGGPDKVEACHKAQEYVKQRLKSPTSAKFPWCSSKNVTDLGNGRVSVAGYVDAANSFNAKLRSRYIVIMKYSGNKNWILEEIFIE